MAARRTTVREWQLLVEEYHLSFPSSDADVIARPHTNGFEGLTSRFHTRRKDAGLAEQITKSDTQIWKQDGYMGNADLPSGGL
jgi:hypothetical protein